MRMDRYKEFDEREELKDEEQEVLSREVKNQDMYKDVYMNNTFIDVDNLFNSDTTNTENEVEETTDYKKEVYEEKSYDVNEYLKKAHEMHTFDDAKRNLEDQDFVKQEDEIKKLIADIEEKEQEEDFFSDLRGDNEDTMIEAKINTDDFDTSIYKNLIDDGEEPSKANVALSHGLGDETVHNLELKEDEKLDHTFEKIIESDKQISRQIKKLPLIIFLITLSMLIIVILIILLK